MSWLYKTIETVDWAAHKLLGKRGAADVPEAAVEPTTQSTLDRAEATARARTAEPEKPLGDPERPAQIYGCASDPWTGRARMLLRDRGAECDFVDLDDPQKDALLRRLIRESGQATTLWVYLRGELVGGYNGLDEIDRLGQLEERLLPAAERGKKSRRIKVEIAERPPDEPPPGERA